MTTMRRTIEEAERALEEARRSVAAGLRRPGGRAARLPAPSAGRRPAATLPLLGGILTSPGIRRDTRVRTRTAAPTFATFEAATDRRPTCDGCGDVAAWRGEVEGIVCDLCSACKKNGVIP